MFCYKKDNKLINKVHKRALRAIHGMFYSNLQELLAHDKSVNIHVRHLHILMTETFKSLHHYNPEIMCNLFQLKERPYDLRGQMLLQIPTTKTITYGTNSLLFKASILWNSLPNEYKSAKSVNIFKNAIKSWSGSSCQCFICR